MALAAEVALLAATECWGYPSVLWSYWSGPAKWHLCFKVWPEYGLRYVAEQFSRTYPAVLRVSAAAVGAAALLWGCCSCCTPTISQQDWIGSCITIVSNCTTATQRPCLAADSCVLAHLKCCLGPGFLLGPYSMTTRGLLGPRHKVTLHSAQRLPLGLLAGALRF